MRFGKIASGVWLCLGLVVFGGGMLLAFFRAAHDVTKSSPSPAALGIPAGSLRLISVNAQRKTLPDQIIEQIHGYDPNYLLLQEIHGRELSDLARRLGGKLAESAYYPLQDLLDADADIGNAILSKHPLEDGRPIPNHMSSARGVWASSVVDGRRFYIACLRLSDSSGAAEMANFVKAWESLGRPPILAAVDAGGARPPGAAGLVAIDADRIWLASGDWHIRDAKAENRLYRIETAGEPTSRSPAPASR